MARGRYISRALVISRVHVFRDGVSVGIRAKELKNTCQGNYLIGCLARNCLMRRIVDRLCCDPQTLLIVEDAFLGILAAVEDAGGPCFQRVYRARSAPKVENQSRSHVCDPCAFWRVAAG